MNAERFEELIGRLLDCDLSPADGDELTDVIPDEVTKKVLRISDRYTRVCITPLGVPVSWPESPPKKALDELIAWESLPGVLTAGSS